MRGFINGVVFTLAILVAGIVVAVKTGALYGGADVAPPGLERLAARTSLGASIDRGTQHLTSPIQPTDDNLIAAVRLYGQNCAVCHGAADAKRSALASGFYIKAPQLASDGVEDDPPAESYWKIKHGIRYTAMPGFGTTLDDTQMWQLALFVATMDKLSPAVETAWKALPSALASAAPLGAATSLPSALSPAATNATPSP